LFFFFKRIIENTAFLFNSGDKDRETVSQFRVRKPDTQRCTGSRSSYGHSR